MARRLAPVLLLVLPLAGCVEDLGPPVSARTVPTDAPSSGGSGGYTLAVRVVDEPGGPPVPGAALIVYWGDFERGGNVFDLGGSASAPGASASGQLAVRLSANPATPAPDTTVPLRTGPDGIATVQMPANRVVGIVGWAPGHTEEWLPAAVSGDGGTRGQMDFTLYRERILSFDNGTWAPAGASPGRISRSNYMWKPAEVQWGANAEARAGYVARLASMDATLTWTNGPTGGGDLALAIARAAGDPDYVGDADTPQAAPGAHTEAHALGTAEIEEHGWPAGATLYVGPATATAFVAPFGLAYSIRSDARFDPFVDTRSFGANDSPGAGAGAVVAGLVAAAVALGRLRRGR